MAHYVADMAGRVTDCVFWGLVPQFMCLSGLFHAGLTEEEGRPQLLCPPPQHPLAVVVMLQLTWLCWPQTATPDSSWPR